MSFSKELAVGIFLAAVALAGIIVPPIYMYSKHSASALSTMALFSDITRFISMSKWEGAEVIHSENFSVTEPVKVRIKVSGGAVIINNSLASDVIEVKVLKPKGLAFLSTHTPKYSVRFGGGVLKADVSSGALVVSIPKGKLSSLYLKVDGGAAKVEAVQPKVAELRIEVNGGAAKAVLEELSSAAVSAAVSGGALDLKLYLSKAAKEALASIDAKVSGGAANIEVHCPSYKVKFVSKASGGLAEFSIDGRKIHVYSAKGSTYGDEGYEEAPKKVSITADITGGIAAVKVMRGEGH